MKQNWNKQIHWKYTGIHYTIMACKFCFCFLFSCSAISDSLQPHGLQHAGPPCPSSSPGAYQTRVHWVGDTIQPSRPLLSPSPAFYFSQHQGLLQWVSSSHHVAKVLQFHGNKGAENIQEYIWQHEIIYRRPGKILKLLSNTKILQQKKMKKSDDYWLKRKLV